MKNKQRNHNNLGPKAGSLEWLLLFIVPGIGVKRATDLLKKSENKWEAICNAYKERGLSDDDALLNARLAKILQHPDYDYDRQEPILWTPIL